jgi:long-chain acyl-CoA synthetase
MSKQSYPLPYAMLHKWASEMPHRVYLRQPVNRAYREWTWAQVHDQVLRLAAAFRSLGLKRGDVVAILGKNTAEWFIADFAITAAGMVSAPIYFTAGEKTIRYVLEHSGTKAIVLGKLDDLGPAEAAIPSNMITIAQPYGTVASKFQMDQLIASHEPLDSVHQPKPDDTFTLIYTSGSTGNPKGVEVSFRNIGYSATAAVRNLRFSVKDRLLSYLPLAHITERAMIQHVSLQHGCTVSFVESLDTFSDDLRNANPTVFISVPRLWMKFQSAIVAKIPPERLNVLLRVPVLSSMLRRRIKSQLGLQNARLCASGAAPISPAVLEWYRRIGIHICEGFGMSETSGLVTSHFPFRADKIGSVGRLADGAELKLTDDGEVLIRSDGVVKGYYKDPEKTAETFSDGWLHTGDRGEVDPDGYIRITGRVKEIFKSGKGKYVVPVPIESLLAENPYIEQVCVMGSGLPQPVAVVVLAEAVVGMLDKGQVVASLTKTLQKSNARLEAHERISHIVVTKDPWTIESGLLTPTMKIKRNALEKRYAGLIASVHGGPVVMEP